MGQPSGVRIRRCRPIVSLPQAVVELVREQRNASATGTRIAPITGGELCSQLTRSWL